MTKWKRLVGLSIPMTEWIGPSRGTHSWWHLCPSSQRKLRATTRDCWTLDIAKSPSLQKTWIVLSWHWDMAKTHHNCHKRGVPTCPKEQWVVFRSCFGANVWPKKLKDTSLSWSCIVEAPISNQDPSAIYKGIWFQSWLGLNFDQTGVNSVVTHVLVLRANVRRNERFKWAIMVDYGHWQYVHANFWLQRSTLISR